MKKYFFCSILLSFISFFDLYAQVKFEEFSSLEKLLSKAKTEKKLVFVQIASENCNQCNEVAQKGLSNSALKEKFAINFLATFIAHGGELYQQIMNKINVKDFSMGSLFLDEDGYLLLKSNTTTSYALNYLNNADQAISLSKNNVLKELDAQYPKEKGNKAFMKKLIQEKNKADFDTQSLVEEFIDLHTIKELSSIENAKLIIEQGLPLESRARKQLYACFPKRTVDSLFRSYSLDERVKINHKVINSTRQIALKTKDKNLAVQLSSFISNTYDRNWEKGNFASQAFLTNFYKEIKDSTVFFLNAESFGTYNLMKMSIDTLKKREESERNAFMQQSRKNQSGNTIMSFSYSPYYIKYANELNSIAYGYFTFTKDLEKLAKALKWAKRAIEIHEALTPDESRKQNTKMMDTYACLLYRLGKKEEAIDWETQAIEALKKRGENTANLEANLNKIKKGEL